MRPFAKLEYSAIKKLFEADESNIDLLELLKNELEHRTDVRSLFLLEKIYSKLKILIESIGFCPICNGIIVESPTLFKCDNQLNSISKCTFKIPKKILDCVISNNQATLILKNGITDLIDGFRSSKTGRTFSAKLTLNSDGRLDFKFEKDAVNTDHSVDDPVLVNTVSQDEEIFECPGCQKTLKIDWGTHVNQISACTNPECNRLFAQEYDNIKKVSYVKFYEPDFIDGIICVDFGTSSIRASLSSPDGTDTKVLKLGAALGDKLDNFLDSKILITNDRKVFFGYESEKQLTRLSTSPLLYESSPKKWLTTKEFFNIEEPIVNDVNRLQLISGLMTYALSGVLLDLNIDSKQLGNYEIRVSHPAWDRNEWIIKKNLLEQALRHSLLLLPKFTQGADIDWLNHGTGDANQYIDMHSSVDITEPVAAAIEAFHLSGNSRQICAVVDIGAGTTDFGLFSVITPEPNELNPELVPYRRKFKSLSEPISINMAGDYIDDAFLELYKGKLFIGGLSNLEIEKKIKVFHREIRDLKPSFFEDGYLVYDDIEISYEELVFSKPITLMIDAINSTFLSTINQAKQEIIRQIKLTVHYIRSIDLVIVGGGFQIEFIRSAFPRELQLNEKFSIPIFLCSQLESGIFTALEEARLAVCKGGTTVADEWPNTNPNAAMYGPLDRKYATSDQDIPN